VDRDFKSWLQKKLGNTNFERIPRERLVIGSRVMKEFEDAKKSFNGGKQDFYVAIPTEVGITEDPTLGIGSGEILLTS
jgi:hypothetical protein